jgi:hypothetical protein
MPSLFKEFIEAYEEFIKKFPDHPLAHQIRTRICLKRVPRENWLAEQTIRMKQLLTPIWERSSAADPGRKTSADRRR